jgi:hypothetical protein
VKILQTLDAAGLAGSVSATRKTAQAAVKFELGRACVRIEPIPTRKKTGRRRGRAVGRLRVAAAKPDVPIYIRINSPGAKVEEEASCL